MPKENDNLIVQIDPAAIDTFMLGYGSYEIRYKDNLTVMKWKASATVLVHDKEVQQTKSPLLPASIIRGSIAVKDGQPRCVKCNTLLTEANHCCDWCWPCALDLVEIEATVETLKCVGFTETRANEATRRCMHEEKIDPNTTNADDLVDKVVTWARRNK